MGEYWVDDDGHATFDESHLSPDMVLHGVVKYCCVERVKRLFWPELGKARCKECGAEFYYYQRIFNSTKTMDPVPRCPNCKNYRSTVSAYKNKHTFSHLLPDMSVWTAPSIPVKQYCCPRCTATTCSNCAEANQE
jgi:hypothetical protein